MKASFFANRSGLLVNGGGYYYQSITDVTDNDGDTFEVLDVLAKERRRHRRLF